MFLQLLQHLSNGFHILFAFAFDIDEDVIKVHYYKNIELFYQYFIDVALTHGQYIGQFERHYMILKMVIAALKNHFSFIAFFDPHSIISIGKI